MTALPTETRPDTAWLEGLTPKLAAFVSAHDGPTPYVVVDLDVVEERYQSLAAALDGATIFYAVKANPARGVLKLLDRLGASFDVASVGEIHDCLAAGIDPERMSFGNTIKSRRAIRQAVELGVWRFAVDSREELDKVLTEAPGAEISVRLLHGGSGADWPLSRKFGCHPALAVELVRRAAEAGSPVGLTFHVGSQQRDVDAWDSALQSVARVMDLAGAEGARCSFVNLGGGFPGSYREPSPETAAYGDAIRSSIARHLGGRELELRAEPGRYLTADAGVLVTEVVSVSNRDSLGRWVYLDVGIFSGLFEALGEAIRYRMSSTATGEPEEVVVAGPTCDSVDVLYEHCEYRLPAGVTDGDLVVVHAAGAYTTAYATAGFNGFGAPDCFTL